MAASEITDELWQEFHHVVNMTSLSFCSGLASRRSRIATTPRSRLLTSVTYA